MLRRLRYSDLESVRNIYLSAFREEYGRRGVDIGAQVKRWKQLYPLLKVLMCFPNPYRHVINVHVWEEDGRLLGFIQTSPGNRQQTRWHIDFVAVAPEAQGRGLGARLVEGIFEVYGARGIKTFTLEVDQHNAPALRLYHKLGFRQYASTTYLNAPQQPIAPPEESSGFRPCKYEDAAELLALHLANLPPQAKVVDGRSLDDFRVSRFEALAHTLRGLLKHHDDHRLVLEERGRPVAYLRVVAQYRNLPHTLYLLAMPGRDEMYPVLLQRAAQILKNYPQRMVLAWASDYNPGKLKALEDWGLQPFTIDHALVRDSLITLKLPNTANEVPRADEKAFKPAFTQTSAG
ncbi:MAG: GNAT family N-acetyltransferase [Candidatus Sericytochromatia bacterium]|nr:GNAT family N-acetyltransferase [Candidatus Sericytochromatia bacterium]